MFTHNIHNFYSFQIITKIIHISLFYIKENILRSGLHFDFKDDALCLIQNNTNTYFKVQTPWLIYYSTFSRMQLHRVSYKLTLYLSRLQTALINVEHWAQQCTVMTSVCWFTPNSVSKVHDRCRWDYFIVICDQQ